MKIKEEIEKLPIRGNWMRDRVAGEFLISKADVLSILDKWECVAEKMVKGVEKYAGEVWFGNEYGGTRMGREICDKVKPGDHIIIWRKKDESSS